MSLKIRPVGGPMRVQTGSVQRVGPRRAPQGPDARRDGGRAPARSGDDRRARRGIVKASEIVMTHADVRRRARVGHADIGMRPMASRAA